MYDPALGRFSTIDPLAELMANTSPYAYAGNNPISYIDYNGENPVIIIGGVAIGLVEAGLLATGVIATGWILTKDSQGRITIGDDLRDFFAKSKRRFKRRGKGEKAAQHHGNKEKAANYKAKNNTYETNGWQGDGHPNQRFDGGGGWPGVMSLLFTGTVQYMETINLNHDELKMENYNSYYPESTSISPSSSGGSSETPVIDPSKVPAPDTPNIIPLDPPKTLPMPDPNPNPPMPPLPKPDNND